MFKVRDSICSCYKYSWVTQDNAGIKLAYFVPDGPKISDLEAKNYKI